MDKQQTCARWTCRKPITPGEGGTDDTGRLICGRASCNEAWNKFLTEYRPLSMALMFDRGEGNTLIFKGVRRLSHEERRGAKHAKHRMDKEGLSAVSI